MMFYDVVVVGAGPAGIACSSELSRTGIKCLLLEQNESLSGKVCGDGLTVRGISALSRIGIDTTELPGKKVYKRCIIQDGIITKETYKSLFNFDYEYGISRDCLDRLMLKHSQALGTKIAWGTRCCVIERKTEHYVINGEICANKIVLACGAQGNRRLGIEIPGDVPAGMSSRIRGNCCFDDDAFTFVYEPQYGHGYAWAFPVSKDIWNVGVWSSDKKNIRELYTMFEKQVFGRGAFTYDRKPKGAVIGATRQAGFSQNKYNCIGDCAFHADYDSGEGISIAVEDGINMAKALYEGLDNGL